uniref:Myosin motor domain-containing protein n=1 Tax=Aegilops tauschii subsp. strangulata TaxID=200361 RepID=A0A452YHK9_AEGTS
MSCGKIKIKKIKLAYFSYWIKMSGILYLAYFSYWIQKPLGLLSLLDEESTFPNATDLTFANK